VATGQGDAVRSAQLEGLVSSTSSAATRPAAAPSTFRVGLKGVLCPQQLSRPPMLSRDVIADECPKGAIICPSPILRPLCRGFSTGRQGNEGPGDKS